MEVAFFTNLTTFDNSLKMSQFNKAGALPSYEHQSELWTPLLVFLILPLSTGFCALYFCLYHKIKGACQTNQNQMDYQSFDTPPSIISTLK